MKDAQIDALTCKAIQMVSQNSPYQKKVLILCFLICLEIALANLINSTIFTNPLFKCGGTTTHESAACLRL